MKWHLPFSLYLPTTSCFVCTFTCRVPIHHWVPKIWGKYTVNMKPSPHSQYRGIFKQSHFARPRSYIRRNLYILSFGELWDLEMEKKCIGTLPHKDLWLVYWMAVFKAYRCVPNQLNQNSSDSLSYHLLWQPLCLKAPLIQRSVHCFWFLYQSLVPNVMKSMFKKRKTASCFPAVGTCLVQSWLDSGRTAGLDENLIELQPAAKTFLAVHLKCFRPNFLFPFISVNSCNKFSMSRIRQKSKSDI